MNALRGVPSSRRDFLKSSSYLFAGATAASILPVRLFGQQAQSNAEKLDAFRKQISGPLQTIKVTDRISLLMGAGGNIGVLSGPEGKIVVDTGVLTSAPAVLEAIGKIDGQPIKYVVNTHWHFDHTDGNVSFHDAGATIVAHTKTRDRLSHEQFFELFQLHFPALPASGLPTRTLTDEFTFYQGGQEVSLQHVAPAHTDTDLFVHFKEQDVVHAGDLFFNGFYPVIDYSTGGSANGYLDAMSRMLAASTDSTKIIPGHGPLGTKAQLSASHDMLATVRDRVAAAKKSGKTLEETIASKPTADLDPVWGKGLLPPDLFVTMVYKSL